MILTLTLNVSKSFAQDELNEIDKDVDKASELAHSTGDPKGFWGFGGLDLGYSWLSTSVTTEGSKSGLHFGVRALASLYLESPWGLDFGMGWFYNHISGTDPSAAEVNVTTRAAFFEAAARYRLDSKYRWQVGLVLDASFGTDITFAPSVGTGSAEIFMGVQGVYDIPLQSTLRMRLSVSLLTDLTVTSRQFWVALFGVQIGLPITTQTTNVQTIYSAEAPAHVVTLDEKTVHFQTNSAKLSSSSKKFLVNFGAFLSGNGNIFDRVRVEGHTDKRGEYNHNLKLSQGRAKSVLQALKEGGVAAGKLESEGYGPSQPIDNGDTDGAYAQNRRVELKFYGVTDPTPINDKIRELAGR